MQANTINSSISGISVLIPVFNFDINPLVQNLIQTKTVFKLEIIIIDDCSTIDFNFHSQDSRIKYIKLEKNIGRSKIRNLLVSKSNYTHLLFLDCDVLPVSENYLAIYETLLNQNNDVLYGGNKYNETPPTDVNLILHWKAGRYKEQKTPFERKKAPYQSFITYNFLIPKKVFLSILFDEKIIGYGHEDTKFGIELQRNGIKIRHIDNPVYHLGINTNESFIKKTLEAVDNLCILIKNEQIGIETKLYKTYKKLKIKNTFLLLFKIFKSIIYKNLLGPNPYLFCLDLIKLQRMVLNFENENKM